MSCCGQKRSALSQHNASGQPGPAAAPGRGSSPLKAAMLAVLARKAVSSGTGAGPRVSPRRSR